MTHLDPQLQAHKDWLGFVQPDGLVVSPRALVDAQAHVDVRAAMEPQQKLLTLLDDESSRLIDFRRFTIEVLRWRADDLRAIGGLRW